MKWIRNYSNWTLHARDGECLAILHRDYKNPTLYAWNRLLIWGGGSVILPQKIEWILEHPEEVWMEHLL